MQNILSLGTDCSRWKLSLFEILLLSIALGIDCLVVSFSQGLIFNSNRLKNSFVLALTMGLFQGLMPVFGYLGTGLVSSYVEKFSSFLVFIIFFILGVKFIKEAFEQKEDTICCIGLKCLISMGIATSIDAFAAGVSLKLSDTALLLPALVIGAASFLMSVSGFWFGNCFKNFPSRVLEISGGLILIGLAINAII